MNPNEAGKAIALCMRYKGHFYLGGMLLDSVGQSWPVGQNSKAGVQLGGSQAGTVAPVREQDR